MLARRKAKRAHLLSLFLSSSPDQGQRNHQASGFSSSDLWMGSSTSTAEGSYVHHSSRWIRSPSGRSWRSARESFLLSFTFLRQTPSSPVIPPEFYVPPLLIMLMLVSLRLLCSCRPKPSTPSTSTSRLPSRSSEPSRFSPRELTLLEDTSSSPITGESSELLLEDLRPCPTGLLP